MGQKHLQNLVQLIKIRSSQMLQELYRAITTRIEIEENSSEDLSLRFSSDCNKKQSKRRTKCSNIPLGTPVEFTVNITLKACRDQLGKSIILQHLLSVPT